MARSHPPSLLRRVRNTLERECGITRGAALGVAVSGGPDSTALAHALSLLREELGLRLAIFSVDHGLRPEARAEVELVLRAARAWNVEAHPVALDLSAGANLQARAREARYRALWSHVDEKLGADAFLATAHHKEDRAETVLLRILRGTSVEGLAVLPARSGRLIRPLIRASRQDVELHVERHKLDVVHDPSNRDPRYLRVRTRTELLPLMKDLGPGVIEHLVGLADDAGRLPEPLSLNREQRQQFRRALDDRGLAIDLPLPGGLRLVRGSRNKSPK